MEDQKEPKPNEEKGTSGHLANRAGLEHCGVLDTHTLQQARACFRPLMASLALERP